MAYRVVIAGCGAMSRGWLEAIAAMAELEVVGLVDPDGARAAQRAEEFGLSAAVVETGLVSALERTRPDFLFDITPPTTRHEVVATALQHGCHVLSEKPMAPDLPTARELMALAERTGRVHAVVQNRRFTAGVRRIRRLIDSGVIGTLTGLHCDFFLAPHFGGFREEMRHVLLLDMAIHTFDAARFMAARVPQAVYCHEYNPPDSWYAHGAVANAIFEMSDDVVFTYRGSWCAEGLPTSWESDWRIQGSRGALLWDGADRFHVQTRKEGLREGLFDAVAAQPMPELADDDGVGGHGGVLRDFVASITAGRAPETVNSDNIKSLAMVFAAIESAETQQRIEIHD